MTALALDAHVVVDRGGFVLDASLQVEAGEVVAVMGPSGAGKSTLVGALAGLVRPTGGRIRVGGRIVDDAGRRASHVAPMRRGVVLLGQEPRLFPHLSAAGNVAFALRARGVARAQARADALGWLDRVGLPDAGDRRPAALSGGQQQRVALARALAAAPGAVLLDEPLTSLDAETAADIRAVLREQLEREGMTAVVVTHDAVDAVALADRLVVLEGGRVTQADATRRVLAAPVTRFAAAVAGVNRLVGVARDGVWTLASADATLDVVDEASIAVASVDGATLAAVFPTSAVTLDAGRSADDAWAGHVVRLEATVGGVRVVVAVGDASVAADVPFDEAATIDMAVGARVAVRVDARRVRLLAA